MYIWDLVHRLDRPVGGVMVFAKTSKAASRLSEQVRNKTFKKQYLAVVNGKMEKDNDTFVDYLWKDEKRKYFICGKRSLRKILRELNLIMRY